MTSLLARQNTARTPGEVSGAEPERPNDSSDGPALGRDVARAPGELRPGVQRATVADLPALGDSELAQRLQPRVRNGGGSAPAADQGAGARAGGAAPAPAAAVATGGLGGAEHGAKAAGPAAADAAGAGLAGATGLGSLGDAGLALTNPASGDAAGTGRRSGEPPTASTGQPNGGTAPAPPAGPSGKGRSGAQPGGPAGAPPVDAKTEISRQAPSVQAPSAAEVREQPPAALIEQQGGAAVRSLGQVAAQAAELPPPAPAPHKPDPLPPPDVGAAMDVEAAAPAAAAMSQRDAAASTAQKSATKLEGVRSGASDVAAMSVQYAAPDRNRADVQQRHASASEIVSGFFTTLGGRAAQVADLGAVVHDRYRAATSATVDRIAGAVEERTGAIAGHVAQLRAHAQTQAESARETVAAQHASASAAITSSTATACQQLETESTSALQAIDARQTAQLQLIEERYRAGDERFRAAGRTVGSEAAQRGEQMAMEYMRGLVDEDDSFLDGPLTYKRGKARADTAHEISKAYQSGLADEANKQADQAQRGKTRDIESVHITAQHARESVQQLHKATLTTIVQAETTAFHQAEAARTSLVNAVAQALAGSQQTLDQHEVTLTENLRAAARAQAASVEQQASDLSADTQDQISEAIASLLDVGVRISAQVQGAAAPALDELAASLGDATAQLDSGVALIQGRIDQGQALGEQQLAQGGQAVAEGLGTSTQTGLDSVSSSAADVTGSIRSIAGSAAGTFQGILQSHDSTTATATAAASGGFNRAVTGVQQAYDEMTRGLEQGFAKSAAGLEQGLRGALGKMEEETRTKAEENAAAVPPRWKSVVKVLLIIAVIVVVALVIGPFVIGAVGAALGTGAVMTGIIAGAIVGAATGATMQVINNWASNRPLGEGVLKAAVIGGIGGAVGGGFGAYFSSAAQAGTTVVNTAFRQFMANTAINVATETVMNIVTTGQFSWEALGMSVLSAVAVGGALHAAGGLKGVKGIQDASTGAGEGFGGAIRSGMGGTVSINYRPTTAASGQSGDETRGSSGGTKQQGDETATGGTNPQEGKADVPAKPPALPADFEVPEDFVITSEGPLVSVPARPSGAPASVHEFGAGPVDTNLGLPVEPGQGNMAVHDPSLVEVTRSDLHAREGVVEINAEQPIPPTLRNQDAVIVNNPRGYDVDIANIGEAVRPGGRIILQGRAEVVPGMRPANPDMTRLLRQVNRGDVPPGFRVVEVVTLPEVPVGNPAQVPKPPDVLGGPFNRTEGGPVSWPNTRIIIERVAGSPNSNSRSLTSSPGDEIAGSGTRTLLGDETTGGGTRTQQGDGSAGGGTRTQQGDEGGPGGAKQSEQTAAERDWDKAREQVDADEQREPTSAGPIAERYDTAEAAIGQVEGEVHVIDKVRTKNPGLRNQGFTETWYVQDSGGNQWTVHHNPRTGQFSGAHPSHSNY